MAVKGGNKVHKKYGPKDWDDRQRGKGCERQKGHNVSAKRTQPRIRRGGNVWGGTGGSALNG